MSIRDAALARVRLATVTATVACVALTGIFAALAAGSTHLKRVAQRPRRVERRPAVRVRPVVAPVPPLVSVGGAAPSAPAPPQPAPAPATTQAPPVVVSSGS